MSDILRDTAGRLIALLEDRQGQDQDLIALMQSLLATCEGEARALNTTSPQPEALKTALDEARQARTALFEEQRTLRVVREERDALAVLTGQLLERAQKAEKLLASDFSGTAREQVLIRHEEDAAALLADPRPHQSSLMAQCGT